MTRDTTRNTHKGRFITQLQRINIKTVLVVVRLSIFNITSFSWRYGTLCSRCFLTISFITYLMTFYWLHRFLRFEHVTGEAYELWLWRWQEELFSDAAWGSKESDEKISSNSFPPASSNQATHECKFTPELFLPHTKGSVFLCTQSDRFPVHEALHVQGCGARTQDARRLTGVEEGKDMRGVGWFLGRQVVRAVDRHA
jgi:hypothetical protein